MLEQYMEKLSTEMELEEPLKAQIPGVYTLPLEDDLKVVITSASVDHFLFSCTVGLVPEIEKEATFTQLLLANLFGQGTQGAILGMDADSKVLTLTQDISYPIEYKEFRDFLEDFVNSADFWKSRLTIPQT